MKKKLLLFFIFIFTQLQLFVFSSPLISNSAFYNNYSLKNLTTEHFTIIYPEELNNEGIKVYENVEKIYSDMKDYFYEDWNLYSRLPIVLTGDIKTFNAYYSPFPHSHIILYVTSITSTDLINSDDTLLSTLEHELTHAYTMKLHSGLLDGFSKVFGDYISQGIFMPNFITEGIAVAFESRNSLGRLNNAEATNIVKTLLYTNSFPHYRQLFGEFSSSSPYGTLEYILGGEFMRFLHDEFESEKFKSLISSFKTMRTFISLIEETYNKSLDEIWSEFHQFLLKKYPHPINPDEMGAKTILQHSGYDFPTVKNQNIYLIDKVKKIVLKYSDNNYYNIGKIKGSINSFDVSEKEDYFLYSSTFADKNITYVVGLNNKSNIEINNSFYASFLELNNDNLIVYKKGLSAIEVATLNGEVIFSYKFENNKEVYNLKGLKNGEFLSLIKEGRQKFIYKFDIKNNLFQISELEYCVSSVFTDDKDVYYIPFDENNILFGVSKPTLLDNNIIYISKNLISSSLVSVEKSKLNIYKTTFDNTMPLNLNADNKIQKIDSERKYSRFKNSLPFSHRGTLLPLFYDRKTSSISSLGLSYFTADSTESFQSNISFGYNPQPSLLHKRVDMFSAHKLSFYIGEDFSFGKWKFYLGLGPNLYITQTENLSVSLDAYFVSEYTNFYNSQNNFISFNSTLGFNKILKGNTKIVDNGLYLASSIMYSNRERVGFGYNEVLGFYTGASVFFKQTSYLKPWNFSVNMFLNGDIPFIIPVKNTEYLTFNLPLKIYFSLKYATNDESEIDSEVYKQFLHTFSPALDIDVTIFSAVINKVPFNKTPIGFNRFTVKFNSSFVYSLLSSDTLYHSLNISIGAEAFFTLSPAFLGTGIASNSFDVGIRWDILWGSYSGNGDFVLRSIYGNMGYFTLIFRTNLGI